MKANLPGLDQYTRTIHQRVKNSYLILQPLFMFVYLFFFGGIGNETLLLLAFPKCWSAICFASAWLDTEAQPQRVEDWLSGCACAVRAAQPKVRLDRPTRPGGRGKIICAPAPRARSSRRRQPETPKTSLGRLGIGRRGKVAQKRGEHQKKIDEEGQTAIRNSQLASPTKIILASKGRELRRVGGGRKTTNKQYRIGCKTIRSLHCDSKWRSHLNSQSVSVTGCNDFLQVEFTRDRLSRLRDSQVWP